ncbi:cyclin-J18-like [Panicum miliaceum]|uniref:Cyclin-J18-like n=1 Tax=Panicum miliaceum TaxID=4540 RepID=A0A3L6TLW5_PANMI|nr:cyclin-J18-like [Panicum miliaceum]
MDEWAAPSSTWAASGHGLIGLVAAFSPSLCVSLCRRLKPLCRQLLTLPVSRVRMEVEEDDAVAAAASAWPGSTRRLHLLQFLLHASKRLDLRPIVKYSALAFFAGHFLPALPRPGCVRKMGFCGARSGRAVRSWLLEPPRDSNLELFALVAVWIASKIHDLRPLSVKSLKALGDRIIADQHFTCRDFANAVFAVMLQELVFMEVVEHNIGSSRIAFIYLEELLIHFREISKLGDLLDLDVCMEILDILYENEDTSLLFNSPCSLAASTLVAAYAISVPKQTWEFPILPWVRFATSYDEEEIMKIVLTILLHVLKPDGIGEKDKGDFDVRCLL